MDLLFDPCNGMSPLSEPPNAVLISFSNIDQMPLVLDPCSSKHTFFVRFRSRTATLEIGHMIISGESFVGSSTSAMSQASMIALSVTESPAPTPLPRRFCAWFRYMSRFLLLTVRDADMQNRSGLANSSCGNCFRW